jgi:plastocyanin
MAPTRPLRSVTEHGDEAKRSIPRRFPTCPKTRFAVSIGAALLLLGACTSPDPSGDVSAGPGRRGAIEVTAADDAFHPDRLQFSAGKEVQIEIVNEDDGTHNFTIDELGLSTGAIDAGAVATARFVVPEGETTFVCTLHPGMEGVIIGA